MADRDSLYQANKSYTRIDSYGKEKREDNKYFHFSIDDTIDCFKDISEKDYESVFDNNFFSWLKYLHDNYGYYLEDKRNQYIYCHDVLYDDEMKIYFFSTDLRVEYIEDVENKLEEFSSSSWNNQLDYLEVFTHEWLLSPELKEMTEEICEWQYMNGYDSCFAEDVIGGY